MEGIKVYTRSPRAREAQAATMEFLLINHPLDCPICDQGGECELQDLAMGYGAGISRYAEKKRVVKDKDIGPLIQTDMTRCIHCTRCVRFGDEVAGLRELGATGRGEHMEIGTYIENAVSSEMSGNVIDLCPVGALTSKPFRYSARAWELRQKPGIAPHDAIGSNISFHIFQGRVKRVVPREHEGINEVWVSDRDRFSYEGLYSQDRLLAPRIKENGSWREVEWETAFEFAAAGLKRAVESHGAERLGALASPAATLEELYLFQKLARALGTDNIDHRLRQLDFSDDAQAPLFPWLGCAIADLERVDGALLIGSYPRKDQPIANHRLRKAAMRGGAVMVLNPIDFDFNYRIAQKLIVPPSRMVAALAGIAKALAENPATHVAEALGWHRGHGRAPGDRKTLARVRIGPRAPRQPGGLPPTVERFAGARGVHRRGIRGAARLSAGGREQRRCVAGRGPAPPAVRGSGGHRAGVGCGWHVGRRHEVFSASRARAGTGRDATGRGAFGPARGRARGIALGLSHAAHG